jgi:hypothetical protein
MGGVVLLSVRTNMRPLSPECIEQLPNEFVFPLDLTHVIAELVCAGREVAAKSSSISQTLRLS